MSDSYRRIENKNRAGELVSVTHYLRIIGQLPSKKNRKEPTMRFGKNRKKHLSIKLPDDVKAVLDDMQLQLQGAWQRRQEPLVHPEVSFKMTASNKLIDSDNCWTTAADLLQKAGIIKQDNLKFFNNYKHILPADFCEEGREISEIWLTEAYDREKA